MAQICATSYSVIHFMQQKFQVGDAVGNSAMYAIVIRWHYSIEQQWGENASCISAQMTARVLRWEYSSEQHQGRRFLQHLEYDASYSNSFQMMLKYVIGLRDVVSRNIHWVLQFCDTDIRWLFLKMRWALIKASLTLTFGAGLDYFPVFSWCKLRSGF